MTYAPSQCFARRGGSGGWGTIFLMQLSNRVGLPNTPTLGRYSLFTIVDAGLFPIIRAKSSCIMHVHDYARRQELVHSYRSLLVKIDQ